MESFDRRMLLGAAGLMGVAALSRVGRAGPVDPPVGPVGPTAKPLSEVEPRTAITSLPITINTPGSYYLAKSFAVAGSTAITIAADNVSIDLMGFTLSQTGVGSFTGILGTGNRRGLAVRNGQIKGFGAYGVSMRTTDACVLEDLLVESSGQSGVIIANGRIARCISRLNTEVGFEVSSTGGTVLMRSCMIIDCRATENTTDGFKMDPGTINNSGGCIISRCVASQNGRYGFFSGVEFVFENCLARQNVSHGFHFEDGCRFESCTAIRNTGRGFDGGGFATIRNCDAQYNTLSGFQLGSVCMVVGCRAISNGGTSTAEAGFAIGGGSMFDGNFAVNNSQGFFGGTAATPAVASVVTRNVCIANGASLAFNYAIGAGNQVGPQYGAINMSNSVLNPYANVSMHSVP